MIQALVSHLIDLPLHFDILLKVSVSLLVCWMLHFAIRRRNPRWRILLWRGAALAVVLVPALTLWVPSQSERDRGGLPAHVAAPARIAPDSQTAGGISMDSSASKAILQRKSPCGGRVGPAKDRSLLSKMVETPS